MKKILLLLIAICASHSVDAQTITITKSRAMYENEGDSLHRIANEFIDAVALALKQNYPAAIVPGETTFDIAEDPDGKIQLTYTTVIEFTDSISAMNHVDHRGALSAAPTEKAAMANAQKRCMQQYDVAVTKFVAKFGKRIYTRYPSVKTILIGDMYYSLAESFIASYGTIN